ncbi:BnaCnng48460D [Brassica napus]|uniref:Uncharacterized protein n=2 Tax=Brassica TaxID=3705 RepID=A0A3P6CHQ5_BRAOL|nr:unnamed protein product [Brassica napus]CDY65721.1 BnaCnng48460D [Brassica napus]VDD07149.1 unnamed protein product [Brassica oleracea]
MSLREYDFLSFLYSSFTFVYFLNIAFYFIVYISPVFRRLHLRLTIDRLQRAETSYVKSLLIQVVANMLYYNPGLTLGVLHNTGLASTVFDLWFQMLQQKRKNGLPANFKREHGKKVCCLGLTSLLALPAGQCPEEERQLVFRATLDLLVAYKNQIAAAKETEVDYENEWNGLESNEDDDDDGSDGEMGMDDIEDGDEDDDEVNISRSPSRALSALFSDSVRVCLIGVLRI